MNDASWHLIKKQIYIKNLWNFLSLKVINETREFVFWQ
jgi:hypothetical protein